MSKHRKKIILGIIATMLVAIVWHNASFIGYAACLGYGQYRIIRDARPISELLTDKSVPYSVKRKLAQITDMRQYGVNVLGLKDTETYTKMYDQQGKELMWVVQACEPFSLQPVMWHFPIVGDVPYKGFFDRQQANQEAEIWRKKHCDVKISNPSGWSTLGWFSDPILSDMLQLSEGDLASLILHEMLHATVFVESNSDFNENLASFIGDSSAYWYLADKYGMDSPMYTDNARRESDSRHYRRHYMRGAHALDSLYKTFSNQMSFSEKLRVKECMIKRIITKSDTLSVYVKRRLPASLDNTFFMSYALYYGGYSQFKRVCDSVAQGDLRKYIRYLRATYP